MKYITFITGERVSLTTLCPALSFQEQGLVCWAVFVLQKLGVCGSWLPSVDWGAE